MQLTLELPDELVSMLHEVEPEDRRAVLIETVCGLYSRERIGSGVGARMLGMTRFEFWEELGKRKIPRHYDLDSLKQDFAFAREQCAGR